LFGHQSIAVDLNLFCSLTDTEVDRRNCWLKGSVLTLVNPLFAKNIVSPSKKLWEFMKTITRLGTFDDVLSKASPDIAFKAHQN